MKTFEDIVKANKLISTMNIKGKEYAEVNQRVKAFRMLYPEGTIETMIMATGDNDITIKAVAKNEEGKILATGLANEEKTATKINSTSYVENCETSAVGRCLGFLGLGIDTSIASYEEVGNAIAHQELNDEKIADLQKQVYKEEPIDYHGRVNELLTITDTNVPKFFAFFGVKSVAQLDKMQCKKAIDMLERKVNRNG